MYFINLLLVTIVLPIVAYYSIPHVIKRSSVKVLWSCFGFGLVYTYLSTFHGYTFTTNWLDTISINIFLFSMFGLISWKYHYFYPEKRWKHKSMLIASSVISFMLYNIAFGPPEACGQRIPEMVLHPSTELKITHVGHQYGFMDYGSRFIIYRKMTCFEKIIGIAINANHYYATGFALLPNLKNDFLIISYDDSAQRPITDTLYIRRK